MQQIVNPRQKRLFDSYEALPAADQRWLEENWPGVFRHVILEQLPVETLRQQVAEDLYQVLRRFADQPTHASRRSYQAMERIFCEQCEIQEEKVLVKDKTGSTVMQNPLRSGRHVRRAPNRAAGPMI